MMEHTMEFPVLKVILSSPIVLSELGQHQKAMWVVRRGLDIVQCGQMERNKLNTVNDSAFSQFQIHHRKMYITYFERHWNPRAFSFVMKIVFISKQKLFFLSDGGLAS